MERQLITIDDLGSAILSYSGISYTASVSSFFKKIMNKVKDYKNDESVTAEEFL